MITVALTPGLYFSGSGVRVQLQQATYDATNGVRPLANGQAVTLDLLPSTTIIIQPPSILLL